MRWWALAAVVVGALAVALALTRDDPTGEPGDGTVRVTVDAAEPGRPVPDAFLGLATEWDSVRPYARAGEAIAKLVGPLEEHFGAPLTLRIGGDTGDQIWWNPERRRPRPRTVLQDATPALMRDVSTLAEAVGGDGARVTLGVNLALDDPKNANALVRAARRALPPGALEAVEIGNEPDFFARPERRWTVPGHRHLRVRKYRTYDEDDYARDTARYLRALSQLQPRPELVVAGFAGPGWWPSLLDMVAQWSVKPDALAAHLYALPQCERPTPEPAWLMAHEQSSDAAARLRPLMEIARVAELPVRASELNSAACGGRPGVSDAPAAALWTADVLFALLAEGAERANLQTWQHARYAPFDVADDGTATAKPPLDGLEAFARAAPTGSRLLATHSGDPQAVRARATVGEDGTVRTLLLAPRAARVDVRAPCDDVWSPQDAARVTALTRTNSGDGCIVDLPAASLAVLTGKR